ncbi:methyltransferase family protein [Kribbella amoyensis]|uniref:Methyltransferase family protein n=2 Tax=Kribbella amoyensis TaxID=996641 RepID=A0A561B8Z8_9ACTN|nr:methyltransferase family protein [Kribbella amoyensis]
MCPARLVLLPAGSTVWVDSLADERIAQVYTGPPVLDGAAQLAERLGVRLVVLAEPVRRAFDLRDIADLHRGETVVVLTSGVESGPPVPSIVEHTGDGWALVPGPVVLANEVTVSTYEQAAELFRSSIPREPNENLISLVDEAFPSGADVLEIGSGTGRDAAELERRGHRVRRTDAAASFVEMLRADGVAADQVNVLTDELGGPYDLVFADAVFLHFTADQLADVLRKAVKAAPYLAFTTREGEGAEWSTRFLDLPRHFTLWQEGPLRELLASTGWDVVRVNRGETRAGWWFHVLARRSST